MATINFTVEDHSIRVDNLIELAQGSNNFDTCAFSFDSTWDEFTLYAVMYQNPKNVFKLPLDEANTRKIPVEVLQKDGWVYIGARGEKEDTDETIATSMVVRLPVRKGAVNGNETGQEMLDQSQYEYLLGKVNELNEKCESLTKELVKDYGIYVGDTQPTNGVMYWLDTSGDSTGGEDTGGDGGETVVTLSSISATYSGGNVAVGTSVNSLTGIAVKATYSDGSTKTITGYTLSGTIAEGENTITVSYGGKTTTFEVTGVAESGGNDSSEELMSDSNIVATGYTIAKNAQYKFYQLLVKEGVNVYEIPVEAGVTYEATITNNNQYGTPYWDDNMMTGVNATTTFAISANKFTDFSTTNRVTVTLDANTELDLNMTNTPNGDGTHTRRITFKPAISGYLYTDNRRTSQTYSIKKVVA